jgi:predicted transcriptional regulator
VKEAHARHKELMRDKRNKTFPAIFIVADASSTENPIDKILYQAEKSMRIRDKIVFDIVSAQFSIHYMFYEENNLKGFFKNVTDRLVDGGVFIATTIDSDRLMY